MLSQLAFQVCQSPVARRALLPCVTTMASRLAPAMARSFATKLDNPKDRLIILGAAGRDFHDFITYWSVQPNVDVKCFTGNQIPGIERRTFPSTMCNNDKNNNKYPDGVKIFPEQMLEELVQKYDANTVTLAYSDLSYDTVQSLAARANAAGCKFVQLPPKFTMVESIKPVISICASRTGVGKSQTTRYVAEVRELFVIRAVVS